MKAELNFKMKGSDPSAKSALLNTSTLGKTKVVNTEVRRKLKPIHRVTIEQKPSADESVVKKLSFEEKGPNEENKKASPNQNEKMIQTSLDHGINQKKETSEDLKFISKASNGHQESQVNF